MVTRDEIEDLFAQGVTPNQIMTDECDGLPYFTPDNPAYPDVQVQLTGTDGNAFAIISAVSKAIRITRGYSPADWFTREAMDCGTYDELLRLVMSTVSVT